MSTTSDDTDLLAQLQQARSELAAARQHEETAREEAAQASGASRQLAELCAALDDRLTRTERPGSGPRGWVKRRLLPATPSEQEAADAAELRASTLFDGAWYLRTYPEVAGSGLSPALHYLRVGASEGKDPGPDFCTNEYVSKHPMIARSRANPLLHHLRTHQ